MLVTFSRKSSNKYSYVLVVILLFFSVGCTKNEAKTSANEQENTMIKNSKIKDYRVENKEYYEELARTTYITEYEVDANNKETKDYFLKDLDLYKLEDNEYYKKVHIICRLTMQGANDKADSKSFWEKERKILDEKIIELEKLNKKYNIAVKE